MSSPSRTAQFQRIFKILKKHYRPVAPDPNRPVLEQLLFGCCLENAHHDAADEAFLGLVHNFFDWNEVRVSTVRELAEVMPRVPDPPAAACRVKQVLQSIFESTYRFDLEDLRKSNLGPAMQKLRAIEGTTPFCVAYVVQTTLGGHAIPVDGGTFAALGVVQMATDQDEQAGIVPGLERAIPKSKGVEFASLLHQLGADFVANPYASRLREVLLEINPDARDRLPKRRSKRAAPDSPGTGTKTAPSAAGTDLPPGPAKTVERQKKKAAAKAAADPAKPQREKEKAAPPAKKANPDAPTESPSAQDQSAPEKEDSGQTRQKASPQPGTAENSAAGLAKKKPR